MDLDFRQKEIILSIFHYVMFGDFDIAFSNKIQIAINNDRVDVGHSQLI